MAVSADQLAGLWRAKLRSLARDHFGRADGTDHAVPWGAALESDGVWTALIERSPERCFGQALVLAASHGATALDLLVQGDPGLLARRAQFFEPSPGVYRIDGTHLEPAEPAEFDTPPAPALTDSVASLLDIADVSIVIEHGEIVAECRGLEVGRVTGEGPDQRLDVGVGAYDQGAFAVIHPQLTPIEALAEVVAQVLIHRRPGAGPHPLNRLVRERWVRSELIADPSTIGLDTLRAVEPIVARGGLKEMAMAAAVGSSPAGETVLVASSVGIDLDAVPAAADLADHHHADRILVVLPDRDRHPLVQAIAAQVKLPVEFHTAPEPWSV